MESTDAGSAGDSSLLLTVEDMACLLKLSVRTVWKYRSQGLIPEPVQLGTRTRWRRAEIAMWIDGGCQPPQD
jgi:predicted DNA-binding transcriptional regulator AlpA